jgi:hypothetical protein
VRQERFSPTLNVHPQDLLLNLLYELPNLWCHASLGCYFSASPGPSTERRV